MGSLRRGQVLRRFRHQVSKGRASRRPDLPARSNDFRVSLHCDLLFVVEALLVLGQRHEALAEDARDRTRATERHGRL
jgi:hypothetical protein